MSPPYLRPFWRYYGGKWRTAPQYPAPEHTMIVEPFAGAAGYSLRYYQRRIHLIEKYPVVAGLWRYLIGVTAAEIRRIPYVEHVDELPAWVPQEGRWLVGFAMNAATVSPCKQLSSGRRQLIANGSTFEGWSPALVERIASQVEHIRHWKVYEDDYRWHGLNPRATWFIDPPYQHMGNHYVHSSSAIDFARLARWCRSRIGQVIVCENEGADWLPFTLFKERRVSPMSRKGEGRTTREVIYTQ